MKNVTTNSPLNLTLIAITVKSKTFYGKVGEHLSENVQVLLTIPFNATKFCFNLGIAACRLQGQRHTGASLTSRLLRCCYVFPSYTGLLLQGVS